MAIIFVAVDNIFTIACGVMLARVAEYILIAIIKTLRDIRAPKPTDAE